MVLKETQTKSKAAGFSKDTSWLSHVVEFEDCLRLECLLAEVEWFLLLVVPDKVGVCSHQIFERLKDL